MQHIMPPPPDRLAYVMGRYHEPIATVKPGEAFKVTTLDALNNKVDSPNIDLLNVVRLPYVNPCTGPIYVEGAEPGDTVAVRIEEIKIPRDYGVSLIVPEFGGLCGTVFTRVLNPPLLPRILIHRITASGIIHDARLPIPPIPIEPFYGTMGTAPAIEAISTLAPGFHGGNMDAADLCPGNTVYFPVQVEGAFLYLGDGHAAQGDAEICGTAVEVPTTGTLTVNVIKRRAMSTPRVENDDYLMSIGSGRPLEDAARIAFYDLTGWLASDYGMDRIAAYQLCSQVARVRLANMVDPLYSVVAKFPKRYLPRWQ